MISPWRILGLLKTAILAVAALVSVRLREAYPLAIFMAGILVMNAAGMRWGFLAGKNLGLGRVASAGMTILRGSGWWGPILAASGDTAAKKKRENRE